MQQQRQAADKIIDGLETTSAKIRALAELGLLAIGHTLGALLVKDHLISCRSETMVG